MVEALFHLSEAGKRALMMVSDAFKQQRLDYHQFNYIPLLLFPRDET